MNINESPTESRKRKGWKNAACAALAAALAGLVNLPGAHIEGNGRHGLEIRRADGPHRLEVVQRPRGFGRPGYAGCRIARTRSRAAGRDLFAATEGTADLDRNRDENCRYKFCLMIFLRREHGRNIAPGTKIDRDTAWRSVLRADRHALCSQSHSLRHVEDGYYQYGWSKAFRRGGGQDRPWFDHPAAAYSIGRHVAQQLVAETGSPQGSQTLDHLNDVGLLFRRNAVRPTTTSWTAALARANATDRTAQRRVGRLLQQRGSKKCSAEPRVRTPRAAHRRVCERVEDAPVRARDRVPRSRLHQRAEAGSGFRFAHPSTCPHPSGNHSESSEESVNRPAARRRPIGIRGRLVSP